MGCSLQKKMLELRKLQERGAYIRLDLRVIPEIISVAQKIREIQFPYKTYDNRRRYSPRYIEVLLDKVLGLLVEGDE